MAAIWEGKGDGLIPVWVGGPMQMASRTNAAWGVAGYIGLRPHKKYTRLCRGIFISAYKLKKPPFSAGQANKWAGDDSVAEKIEPFNIKRIIIYKLEKADILNN